MANVAVYGTLRYHQPLFNMLQRRYGPSAIRLAGSDRIFGWKMYDLGSFPAVCQDHDSSIVVDFLETTGEVWQDMLRIESGYRLSDVAYSGSAWRIFHMLPGLLQSFPEVPSGNWVAYQNDLARVAQA